MTSDPEGVNVPKAYRLKHTLMGLEHALPAINLDVCENNFECHPDCHTGQAPGAPGRDPRPPPS